MRLPFIIFSLFLILNRLEAQEILDSTVIDSISVSLKTKVKVSPLLKNDSIRIRFFSLADIYLEKGIKDTLLENIQYYNPITDRTNPYADLGNLGSAHTPLLYIPNQEIGFRIGKEVYALYLKKNQDLKFYNSNRPLTNLFYSQGQGQNNTQFKGAFAKNFTRGIHFSIEYQKIIHQLNTEIPFNQNAIYKTQTAAISSLITGFWYQSRSNRYNAFLSFRSNYIEQRYHGGVNCSTEIANQIKTANQLDYSFSIPLLASESPKARNSSKKVTLAQYYQLSSLYKGNTLVIAHEMGYETQKNKFYDTTPDSNYYQQFLIDKRGLRNLIKDNIFSNEVNLKWINTQTKNGSKELFSVGLLYNYHHVLQEPDTSNVNDIFAIGKINLPISKFGILQAKAKLGLGNSTGDLLMNGQLKVALKKIGDLYIGSYFTRFQPSLLQSKLNISSSLFWKNDFKKIINFGLEGHYIIPKYNFEVGIKSHTVTNFIYLNQNQKYQQTTNLIAILQIYAQKDLHWKILHLKNRIIFQKSGNLIRLPSLLLNHSLFLQGNIFKKRMMTKIGFDFKWNKSYKGNQFNFLIGDFYLQDKVFVPEYPSMDVFFDMKVQNFRAFIKLENIYAPFTKEVYYQVPYYLKREMSFRFGIHWDFWDKKRQKSSPQNSKSKKSSIGNSPARL